MIAIVIIVFIFGVAVGFKFGGEQALRRLAESERQKMRSAAGLKPKR